MCSPSNMSSRPPAPLLEQTGVYLPYRPSRISFATAGEHPTALVRSVAMGSIRAPIPDLCPLAPRAHRFRAPAFRLPARETVVCSGHAWAQTIPGRFAAEQGRRRLDPCRGRRSLSQGLLPRGRDGCRQGRQIAACILDNWLQGRRRNIWVTKNAPLLEDARRDWTALGGLSGDIQPISNWKIDEPIRLEQGSSSRHLPDAPLDARRSQPAEADRRLGGGHDFQGVLAFDEAHEMGGVAGGEGALGAKEGSQQGICGVLLRTSFPVRACSMPRRRARPTSTISHMRCASVSGDRKPPCRSRAIHQRHPQGRHRGDGARCSRSQGDRSTWRGR